jgi:hypothetical protein
VQDIWQISSLSQDDLILHILPGIGGRLWDITYKQQSLLFQNNDLVGHQPDLSSLENLPTRSPQFAFPLWGGEKTWIAPDSLWPDGGPYPVLDSGSYEIVFQDEQQITMQSQICNISQLQIERSIKLGNDARITISHKVTNHGLEDRMAGIWSVLMLDHPTQIGVVSGPQTVTPIFGKPDGHYRVADSKLICVCETLAEFKIGADNPNGRVFLKLGEKNNPIWMACLTKPPSPHATFAHDHSLEIFNSGDYQYCEAEWHAPAKMLKPNESTMFEQTFIPWSGEQIPDKLKLTPQEMELMSCMS